jgi:hypothetical protein
VAEEPSIPAESKTAAGSIGGIVDAVQEEVILFTPIQFLFHWNRVSIIFTGIMEK